MAIILARDGEVRLRLPKVDEKSDGTLWFRGMPLLAISDPKEKERVKQLVKAQKYNEIPKRHFARMGENPENVWVGDAEEWYSRPDVIAAERKKRAEEAKQVTIYLSSRGWGDFSGVEWSGDITRPKSEILKECRSLLESGTDVDNRNQPDDEIIVKIEQAKNNYSAKIAKMQEEAKAIEEREARRKECSMTTRLEKVKDEGGITTTAHHTVTLPTGESFKFTDRNIFDFGRVINPEYEIAPGKKGGLRDGDNWTTFVNGDGWIIVRPLTAAEKAAMNYVTEFGYHANCRIRM